MFGFDPVSMLDDPDRFAWSVRVAAHNVVTRDEKEAHDRQSKAARVAGSRRRR